MTLPTPLAALAAHQQFILWKTVILDNGKATKVPCSPFTGAVCDAHAAVNWTDAATAYAVAATNPGYGVGFTLTAADPYVVFDLDKCLLPDNTWSHAALELVARLPGAAVEVSQSGKGLHIWTTASHVPSHGCKNTSLGFEMYHTRRFIALGGHPGTIGNAATDVTALLPAITNYWFPPSAPSTAATEWIDAAVPEWRGSPDDIEMLRRMLGSKPSAAAMFGGRATLVELWSGDVAALARCYPSSSGDEYDRSSADAALAAHLCWWLGGNPVRIERMLQFSGLYRDKYTREDYLQRTISNAVSQSSGCYVERGVDLPAVPTTTEPQVAYSRAVDGSVFCNPDEQVKLWEGCAYITEDNKILTGNGELLDESRFKSRFGGLVYIMDAANEKKTDNAWEAFVHSKAIRHTKVDRSSFRPDLPTRSVYLQDGLSFINSYKAIPVPRMQGDVTLFLNHLVKLFPNDRDRAIVTAYLAALVQYQGHKFNWALFIQGTHGNGKSLLSMCVKAAIGDVHCHMPRADGLTAEYNDWLGRTTFCGVEDVYLPTGRVELLEILKPMITLEYQPIRAMRVSQTMKRVCTNFLLNSNHKDGIKKTDEDRRLCPIFCAQQERTDLARDGMGPEYFTTMFNWLDHQNGYAIVAEFLHTYAIPVEFGLPSLKGNAPVTTSTLEAISLSAGCVDTEVLEAIAQYRAGFSGGWVSSIALDALLKEKRMEGMVTRTKRPELMKRLGYVHHPDLHHGRATAPILGSRPILYIKKGHPNGEIEGGAAISRAYEAAQGAAVNVFGRVASNG
jgi:hypothetical protein